MNSSLAGNDPRVLVDFLYNLMCAVKRPVEMELLVDVIWEIEQPPETVRHGLSAVIPIDRDRIRK